MPVFWFKASKRNRKLNFVYPRLSPVCYVYVSKEKDAFLFSSVLILKLLCPTVFKFELGKKQEWRKLSFRAKGTQQETHCERCDHAHISVRRIVIVRHIFELQINLQYFICNTTLARWKKNPRQWTERIMPKDLRPNLNTGGSGC